MAKLTVNEAVKHFDISRPTLTKALKSGIVSGVKDGAKGWQIEPQELARVYSARVGVDRKVAANVDNDLHQSLRDQITQLKDQIADLKEDKKALNDQIKFLQEQFGGTKLIEDKTKQKKKGSKRKDKKSKKGKKHGKKS